MYMEPKTNKDVRLPKQARYKPNAFRLFQPVRFCMDVRILSNAGAIPKAIVSLKGLRKCCKVQNPAHMIHIKRAMWQGRQQNKWEQRG